MPDIGGMFAASVIAVLLYLIWRQSRDETHYHRPCPHGYDWAMDCPKCWASHDQS